MSTNRRTDRTHRTMAVLERLVPLLMEQGVSRGPWSTRWVRPPYEAVMAGTRLNVSLGRRRLLTAELDAHAGVRVRRFAGGGWDAALLATLAAG